MKLAIYAALYLLGFAQPGLGQTDRTAKSFSGEPTSALSANSYVVIGAAPDQEAAVRVQIQIIRPAVAPLRIIFVPHWKYLDAARTFRLHVPTGFASVMFTHLPSRTVFIDNDRYLGEAWLGHWMAHELGHLATNSAREDDAERAAREYRKRLKDARKETHTEQFRPTARGASASARGREQSKETSLLTQSLHRRAFAEPSGRRERTPRPEVLHGCQPAFHSAHADGGTD